MVGRENVEDDVAFILSDYLDVVLFSDSSIVLKVLLASSNGVYNYLR